MVMPATGGITIVVGASDAVGSAGVVFSVGVGVSVGVVVPLGVEVPVAVAVAVELSVVRGGCDRLGGTVDVVGAAAEPAMLVPAAGLVPTPLAVGPSVPAGNAARGAAEVGSDDAGGSVVAPSPAGAVHPPRTSERVCSGASEVLVAVPTDAVVVRGGASGADETMTAVRTATPSAALPAATVHQTRRGDRRLCRPLIARPPASTHPCAALPEPPVPPRRQRVSTVSFACRRGKG
jgi:hypothetical protein